MSHKDLYETYPEFVVGYFGLNDRVKIKSGATLWMKERNYWLEDMGENIDGYYGEIVEDYTSLPGDDAHFGVNIGFDYLVGVNPQWLEKV